MRGTLKKLEIKQGLTSRVNVGAESTGNLYVRGAAISDFREVKSLSQIQEGDEVLVRRGLANYIKTSPIQEILGHSQDSLEFNTQTSKYKLTLEKEEEQ